MSSSRFALLASVLLLMVASPGTAQELVSLTTRENVTQSYFLAGVPKNPRAVALLFPGSGGSIRLRKEGNRIRFGNNNFLVRSRREFTKRGVIAAIPDAPSDQQKNWGMSDEFRLGEQHFTDILAVVQDLGKRFPHHSIYLTGTSRGSISAAALAVKFNQGIAGAVLTASMFRAADRKSNEPGPGLSGFDFAAIKTPLLIVHHIDDQCRVTPYGDAARLAESYPLISVWGGSPSQSGPCEPFSQHGFMGKQAETIEQIVNWMLKRPFLQDIK